MPFFLVTKLMTYARLTRGWIFFSEEISTLMGGGVGVTSGASQLSATNQANLAQQAEEARRLQERAAGAAMGTVGNTHMGGTASPTG